MSGVSLAPTKDKLRELSKMFLKTTVIDVDKIEDLNKDLVEVLYPCIIQEG